MGNNGMVKTKIEGVYQRVNLKKPLFKKKPDVAFYITYYKDGRKIWEKVGYLSELVWKIWTSQKVVLSDKLLGSRRHLTPLAGSPIHHIRNPIVKSLMRPRPIVELEINS